MARNFQNIPLIDLTIGIQFSILKGSITGNSVYVENHATTTDTFGIFNLAIGTGAIQSGVFANIDWSNDKYFLSVGLDTTGSNNFILMGTTQLLSVPYALYAKNAGNTQYQTLSISNDTIFLSPNGGFVKLPASLSGGSNTILLSDSITDSQASAKIAQELGPNTQNIYILNTTQLTTANFNSLSQLIEVRIENNAALQSFSFTNLATTLGNISIFGNTALQAVSFPSLTNTHASVTINSNPSLQSISISNLNSSIPEY